MKKQKQRTTLRRVNVRISACDGEGNPTGDPFEGRFFIGNSIEEESGAKGVNLFSAGELKTGQVVQLDLEEGADPIKAEVGACNAIEQQSGSKPISIFRYRLQVRFLTEDKESADKVTVFSKKIKTKFAA